MRRNIITKSHVFGLIIAFSTLAIRAAEEPTAKEKEFIENSGGSWWPILLVAAAVLGFAFYFWQKSKKGDEQPKYNYGNRYKNYYSNESYDIKDVDADKEMEWLRKAKKGKSPAVSKMTFGPKNAPPLRAPAPLSPAAEGTNLDTKLFQEKMRRLQYAQLPINSFSHLSPSKLYDPLPTSEDDSLLNAVDQANEEYEEDESIRGVALRVLSAFRTRNSVEALSQIALYDLSSTLRSKAVSTLTEFDHESVFEALLLACADPTREVRAAAARGLFRLNFDRADAWKRIIETNDEFRMGHAARAAIEAGIVVKSFDRLVHEDMKVSYEAFVLVTLMIKAGQTEEIFDAIKTHKDERVKYALLHVIKVSKDERMIAGLQELRQDAKVPTDVADRIRDTIDSFVHVMA